MILKGDGMRPTEATRAEFQLNHKLMKIIPRFFHGVLDYMTGLLLVMAPNLLGFAHAGGAVVWVPRIAGLMILLQALTTDYELGVMKMVPIKMHLMTDYLVAIFLVVSPWLFGFSNRSAMATVMLVLAGFLVGGTTLMTEPRGRPRKVMA
jgi:SPW repeat